MGTLSQATESENATFADMKPTKIAFTPETLTKIRKSQRKEGMSMRDLAKLSDVSVGMISLIEQNQTAPSEIVLRKLGKALNVIFTCDWRQERAEPKRLGPARDSKPTDEGSEGTAGE